MGKRIKVQVSFTDNLSGEEALSGRRPDPAPKRMWTARLPSVVEAASQPMGTAMAAAVDKELPMDLEARPQSVGSGG